MMLVVQALSHLPGVSLPAAWQRGDRRPAQDRRLRSWAEYSVKAGGWAGLDGNRPTYLAPDSQTSILRLMSNWTRVSMEAYS